MKNEILNWSHSFNGKLCNYSSKNIQETTFNIQVKSLITKLNCNNKKKYN